MRLTDEERRLVARRPRSGLEYERVRAIAIDQLLPLAQRGLVHGDDLTETVEALLDISWLAKEGLLGADECERRVRALAAEYRAKGAARGQT